MQKKIIPNLADEFRMPVLNSECDKILKFALLRGLGLDHFARVIFVQR